VIRLRPLIILHSDAGVRAQVRRIARHGYDVREVDTWAALRATIREAPPVAVVIVDPYLDFDGPGPATELRGLLEDFYYVPVVALMETRIRFRDLLVLSKWGISEVVSLDQELVSAALPQRLDALEGSVLRSALRKTLPIGLPGTTEAILLAVADMAAENGSTEDLARRFSVSRRTVTRWCARAALPPPRRLLAWSRLLLAAELLGDARRKIHHIALAVGYSSDNAFRTAVDAFLSRTPKELRREGAFVTVSGAFWSELERLRSARRQAPRS